DLGHVARDLGLPLHKVQRTVELLDEGNTVPFITRYRKDETGGLDEEQIRSIQAEIARQRLLLERKQTILKSIESQGKLTPELAEQIRAARSPKHLEDLYLPFKPKKQTLATIARQRGLQPLATEVLDAAPGAAVDLQARAAEFVAPDRKLETVEDVLAGVRHLIAEIFSERAELRSRLRRILQRTGRLVSVRVEPEKRAELAAAAAAGEAGEASSADAPTGATGAPSSSDPAQLAADAHDGDDSHGDDVHGETDDIHDEMLEHLDDDDLPGDELPGHDELPGPDELRGHDDSTTHDEIASGGPSEPSDVAPAADSTGAAGEVAVTSEGGSTAVGAEAADVHLVGQLTPRP
ncbi:MAG TPA: Tex-like N-terminal domain-containing protein, partial [Pirellulaceae bacterium]|nr:Tex-like N-terminal domain-containing protein [Pirellulaceae bacterium]